MTDTCTEFRVFTGTCFPVNTKPFAFFNLFKAFVIESVRCRENRVQTLACRHNYFRQNTLEKHTHLAFCLSVSVCLSFCLSVSVSLSICLSLSLSLSPSLSPSLSLLLPPPSLSPSAVSSSVPSSETLIHLATSEVQSTSRGLPAIVHPRRRQKHTRW